MSFYAAILVIAIQWFILKLRHFSTYDLPRTTHNTVFLTRGKFGCETDMLLNDHVLVLYQKSCVAWAVTVVYDVVCLGRANLICRANLPVG